MKIKLIMGFRRDQEYSIDAEEAHKAYYLFLHPESRGIFSNGLAVVGSNIQDIVPDYQGSMGWNPSYTLGDDDWNEIRAKGVDREIAKYLVAGKEIARLMRPDDMNTTVTQLLDKYPQTQQRTEVSDGVKQLAEKMRG